MPGSLTSRGALSLKWAINRLVNEFEGKAPAAYASEAAVVREALEAEEDKDEGTTSSERSLLGGLSREEGRCLRSCSCTASCGTRIPRLESSII